MPSKVIRDPLYNYISIDQERDRWLVELLDCPEVQRLRRIHQLGVSDVTYPGASHTRFAHTLGVLHLMQQMYQRVEQIWKDASVSMCRPRLMAAAVLHDVGHGPFSHLFEPCLDIDHEEWSVKIILDPTSEVNKVLRTVDPQLSDGVAKLIEKDNYEMPQWQKFLLSSQLDVDRMDYLRRDSLFTGSGYGHFDWHRLINTLELHKGQDGNLDIVWPEKAKFAIEEYIFARFYMYQNVYLHKTTRGFEKMVEAMWNRAKQLRKDDTDVLLVPTISAYWDEEKPTVKQYLAIEEFTVLQQIQQWQEHDDRPLSELARRFLHRDRFAMIEAPPLSDGLADGREEWEDALKEKVNKAGYPPESFCLRDQLKGKYNQPYFPEKESDEQSAKNAIRIRESGREQPVEISQLLPRLDPITAKPRDRYRYYVPDEARAAAEKLSREWKTK
ncbi:MAG: HD domain-containing protein [Phycisphaerales bacterium]|nr:HD domain-containing protein [Phycisphaerales bacterium]